jgi:CRP-like cAMP-binding protein
MTIEDDIAFLERVPIFRRLGPGGLRILAIGTESHSLQSGEVLFTQGETADGGYVIQHGSFALSTDQGKDSGIVAGPGTLLGEMALLTEAKRPATARAREDSTVLRIPRSMFMRMLEGFPDAAQRLRDLLASRTDQWASEMQNVRAALTRDTGENTE